MNSISRVLGDDLKQTLRPEARLKVAAKNIEAQSSKLPKLNTKH